MNAPDGALISAGGALLMLALAVILGIEARLLAEGHPPITSYTRLAILHWPGPALGVIGLVLFALGGLAAHFAWDAACG